MNIRFGNAGIYLGENFLIITVLISFHDGFLLQIRYSAHSPLVLHGITCTFHGGKKIGVVGRTGSGKVL